MASDQQEGGDVVREAGLLERFHITRTKLGFDSCVVVTAQYNASGVLLNRQTLYPALSRVVQANAALSTQVDLGAAPDTKTNAKPPPPRFVRLPVVSLDAVVSFVSDSALEHLITDEFLRPIEFGTAAPLWRLTVVSGRTLLFAFHHSVGDGQSGVAFHAALLHALNHPSEALHVSGDRVSVSPEAYLVPPIEALTSVSVSWGKFFSTILGAFLPKFLTKGASAWTGNDVVSAPSLDTHVSCWEIDADQVTELMTLCRKNSTTLTACLHTLVVGVLARLIATSADRTQRVFKTIATSVPVSLRRFTGASPHVLCDHIAGVKTYVPISSLANTSTSDPWFSWAAAARFKERVQKSMKSTREDIGTLRYLYALGAGDEFFTGALGKKRGIALELSNVGRFPAPPPGETFIDGEDDAPQQDAQWTLGSVYFAQGDPVSGAALKMNVAGSPTGTVTVVFSWGEGALDNEFAEAVIRDTKAALTWVIQSSLIS
ncbi:alcohol acetyltransferase-like protein [Phanerochaete sordida]|uniref:Alcohol acetyltransferase-like protein n=1 Tax=Phanerochaete sordida TaxID=48140 RepID=A0A9P3G2Y8_9APHY|nr:alcohol acetyltransferase-like protein [Phanerochaete sordida]